uniref:Uncharacterized protein n=1 Tax=Onchocerca volvulus TaxID=6282 RepID=A0A8R1TTL2_ONCVO
MSKSSNNIDRQKVKIFQEVFQRLYSAYDSCYYPTICYPNVLYVLKSSHILYANNAMLID